MKKDFDSFYNSINQKGIDESWEETRKKKSKMSKIAVIFIIIFDLTIILLLSKLLFKISIYGLIIIIPIIFFCIVIDIIIYAISQIGVHKYYNKYSNLFKDNIIDKILKNFFTEVDYIPKKQMPEQIYNEGKYDGFYNRYYSDDYIEALIDDKNSIKMADMTIQKVETETDSDGHTTTHITTIFSGLFAKIDIGKSINNELRIKQNGTVFKKNRLEMDSEEFEKNFDVISTNDIVGMQLLTHDVMELLVDYRNLLNRPFDIFIKDNIMYVRLHVGSMFEAKINKKNAIDKECVERYYNTVEFIYSLSKMMIKLVEETQI